MNRSFPRVLKQLRRTIPYFSRPFSKPFSQFNHETLILSNNNLSTLRKNKMKQLNLGKNYFANCNPQSKNTLYQLLDAYTNQLSKEELLVFEDSLDIHYLNEKDDTPLSSLNLEQLDLSTEVLQHLGNIVLLNRIAIMFARYEYTDYEQEIKLLNSRPKEKRNRMKYVFTSHPTQPNSINTLVAVHNILRGLEQNDNEFINSWMKVLYESNKNRDFIKPTYIQESVNYHNMYLTSMIKGLESLYDMGLTELSDYWELPGTWLTFDFDNHPEMKTGIMTYTHSQTINLTVNYYKSLIENTIMLDKKPFTELNKLFDDVIQYAKELSRNVELFMDEKISQYDFFHSIKMNNVYKLELLIERQLESLSSGKVGLTNQATEIAKKLQALFKVFKIIGVRGQIRVAGEDLLDVDMNTLKPILKEILTEISLLQVNYSAIDMIIIANYTTSKQYDFVEDILAKYNIGGVEIVPLLETYSSTNDTDSKITMIASSDTRQRDGMLLTELITLKEFKNHPDKTIYMGQGITAERGGGPYSLIHMKYKGLTKSQRVRHIRTVQGHYFVSEFASKDLASTFMVRGMSNLNTGDSYNPSDEYMKFLEELDDTVGQHQRQMQKTQEFNDFYVNNPTIRTLVESFNYCGSRELSRPLTAVKKQRAIVQAYINSDRNSFTHPELAFWENVTETQIKKLASFYYDRNPHVSYLLLNYMYMIMRFDLEFGKNYVGLDTSSVIFENYKRGFDALARICNYCGINKHSVVVKKMMYQHVGLHPTSSAIEYEKRVEFLRTMIKIQNLLVKKYNIERVINQNSTESHELLRRVRYIQTMLANVTSFTGKG